MKKPTSLYLNITRNKKFLFCFFCAISDFKKMNFCANNTEFWPDRRTIMKYKYLRVYFEECIYYTLIIITYWNRSFTWHLLFEQLISVLNIRSYTIINGITAENGNLALWVALRWLLLYENVYPVTVSMEHNQSEGTALLRWHVTSESNVDLPNQPRGSVGVQKLRHSKVLFPFYGKP